MKEASSRTVRARQLEDAKEMARAEFFLSLSEGFPQITKDDD